MNLTPHEKRLTFPETIYKIVQQVPRGKVTTYGALAKLTGRRCYRYIGLILSQNKDDTVPCHRVVKSDGTIGGFSKPKLPNAKKNMLEKEGIDVDKNGRIIDFHAHLHCFW